MTAIAIHSFAQRSSGSNTSDGGSSLLQHAYFIAALAVILALVILRVVVLRWRNQRMSDFFHLSHGVSPQNPHASQPNDSNYGSAHGVQLAPLPAAYRPDRRIHAADTDALGRRLDPVGEDWDGKDALPAYDSFDRPPKYIEAGWLHRPLSSGEQSGMAYPSTFTRADQSFDDTHSAMERPTTHHDLVVNE